jgi:ribosomal protein L16 Arg81 hydroxylase
MDEIWRKAAKKLREHEEYIQTRFDATSASGTISGTTTTASTKTLAHPCPTLSPNTAAQLDARLLQMERDWSQTRSGPFPEKTRNSMMSLRAALVIREEEATCDTDTLSRVLEEKETIDRQERSQQGSRKKAKTPAKFNWAEEVDASDRTAGTASIEPGDVLIVPNTAVTPIPICLVNGVQLQPS